MGLKATPQEISDAAASCSSTATTISDQLADLKSYVGEMESIWGGVASITFQELMANYGTYSNMLYNALMDISSGLNGNAVNYVDGEVANVKSINNVNDALGAPQINLT